MKTFLVFCAALLLQVSFLAHYSDLNRFALLQKEVKVLAEECASGAALQLDEASYALGRLVIDEGRAQAFVEEAKERARRSGLLALGGRLRSELVLFDDEKGYAGCQIYGLPPEVPGAAVAVTYEGEDLFRLPFLSLNRLSRRAAYCWQ